MNLQDEEGLKSVAPPPTAPTEGSGGPYGVAVDSSCQYKWRPRGDF